MTKVKDIDVEYVCRAHGRSKSLNPRDPVHVLLMLRAEGHKRVESFLFERHFISLLRNGSRQTQVSLGWMYQTNEQDDPYYWFRHLTRENLWNASCDNRVTETVWAADGEVVAVTYDDQEHRFKAKILERGVLPREGSRGSDIDLPLEEALSTLLGKEKPAAKPRNYRHIRKSAQKKALELIKRQFSNDEVLGLALSRLLINCYLFPWFGQQPVDIDACIATNSGLRFVEFKRKYPAKDGGFGIDDAPHGAFVDWLSEREMALLHVILVDPLWDKNASPTHLFDRQYKTSQHAVWLGVELDGSAFYPDEAYQTRGGDSGMTGGRRTQRKIISEAMVRLGTGLNPEKLHAFLCGPSEFEGESQIEFLKEQRDSAREIYRR